MEITNARLSRAQWRQEVPVNLPNIVALTRYQIVLANYYVVIIRVSTLSGVVDREKLGTSPTEVANSILFGCERTLIDEGWQSRDWVLSSDPSQRARVLITRNSSLQRNASDNSASQRLHTGSPRSLWRLGGRCSVCSFPFILIIKF
jgi:hypothetical protein